MSKTPEKLLTEREVAEILGLTVATLRNRRYWRKPPQFVRIDRTVRYRRIDIEQYIANSCVAPRG